MAMLPPSRVSQHLDSVHESMITTDMTQKTQPSIISPMKRMGSGIQLGLACCAWQVAVTGWGSMYCEGNGKYRVLTTRMREGVVIEL